MLVSESHGEGVGSERTNGLEQLRMTQRKLNQLADLSHLLAHATNVVVPVMKKSANVAQSRLAGGLTEELHNADFEVSS